MLKLEFYYYLLADPNDELAVEKYSADSAQDTQLGSLGSRQGKTDRTARWEDLDCSSPSSLQCQCSGQVHTILTVWGQGMGKYGRIKGFGGNSIFIYIL